MQVSEDLPVLSRNSHVALLFSFLFFSCALTLLAVRPVSAAPTDFNQDGRSELLTVTILKDNTLRWSNFNLNDGLSTNIANGHLGSIGHHLVPAHWTGGAVPEIGVTMVNGSRQILWKVSINGALQQRVLGKRGQLVVAGADFNGDGIADGAVARSKKGKVLWTVAYNLFMLPADAQSIKKSSFGQKLGKVFYARPKAGNDWLGALVRESKSDVVFRFKNTQGGRPKTSKTLPAFVDKAKTSRPFPIRQVDGTDLIGFSRAKSGGTRIDVFRANGKRVSTVTLPGTGDVVVGDFTADPGEEIGVKDAAGTELLIFNPITKQIVSAATSAGIAVDDINITILKSGSGSKPSNPTPEDPGDPTTPPPVGGDISCSSIVDISTLPNMLYKNENLHGSRGRTWLDQGHRMGGTRTLVVAGLDGTAFACFGLYACDQPFGCRYYQAMCGDTLSNSAFSRAAMQHGNGSPYALVSAGSGTCYKFKADTSRYGNIIK